VNRGGGFEMGCFDIFSKKIASIGVWGNGRFPQLNIRSAVAAAKQGCCFSICCVGIF